MRPIKFRAWDKLDKKMIPENCMVHFYDEEVRFFDQTKQIFMLYPWNDVELMQFTGLKDKNGKEIYEGDVVSYGDSKREVKFGSFYAYLENGLGGGYYITGFYFENPDGPCEPIEGGGEIIGNIYENPELLKV